MKKFTDEDLILYLYKDCPPKMQAAIEEAAEGDLELSDRLQVLKRTVKQLSHLTLASPSKASLKVILKYAKASFKRK